MQPRCLDLCSRSFHFHGHGLRYSSGEQTYTFAIHEVENRELLSAALPGRPTKQAPRMLVGMLGSLVRVEADVSGSSSLRVHAWWIQSTTSPHFSDHRGVSPKDITFVNSAFSGRLTRAKNYSAIRLAFPDDFGGH